MNLHQINTHYAYLSPEERFRLILAASGRDDATEREKLLEAGQVKNLALADHWPYAQAFTEISMFTFMELSEEAALYHDCLMFRESKSDGLGKEDVPSLGTDPSGESQDESVETISKAWLREFDLLLVTGCQLQLKLKGWELFCAKLQVPDRLLWRDLPGYRRLEAHLDISKNLAFKPIGLLRWLNRKRPKGTPKLKRLPISARLFARANEEAYRQRARWWGARA